MELSKQIRKYREAQSYSQETLAERVYVSRQTISNWENAKSYPDVHSLVLLSEVFGVSVDILLKGDVVMMKQELGRAQRQDFKKWANLLTIAMLGLLFVIPPLLYFWRPVGIVVFALMSLLAIYTGIQVEKQKRHSDIQTYKEILAFMDGKPLDEIAQEKEKSKRKADKLIHIAIVVLVSVIMSVVYLVFLRK